MNLFPTFINSLALMFSVGTAGTVFVHDTNIDKATLTALAMRAPELTVSAKLGNDPHTHSERMSLYQAVRDIHSSQPRTQPRNQEDRRYVQSKPSARGHHPFDNYTLPLVS